MRIWLNKHFGFSKGEFNGLLLLIFIIIILKTIPIIYGKVQTVEKDDPNLLSKIHKLEITDQQDFYYTRDRIESSGGSKEDTLFNFVPNNLSVDGWQSLGLSIENTLEIITVRLI